MPRSRKRTYATTNLDHGAPTLKRGRFAEIIVLSSDSESDALDLNGVNDGLPEGFGVEYGHDEEEDEDEDEDEDEEERDDESQESHGPQYHRSRSLIEQLQKDAFDDFKTDIRLELDRLRSSTADLAPVEDDRAQDLRDVLREWVEQDKSSRRTSHLYYRLDHTYDENRFPPEPFLGRDAVVMETLDRMAGELHLEIFLALLDREDSGPTPDYLVRSLVDRHGHELISDIPVDDNLVQARVPSLEAQASVSEVAVMLAPRDSVVDFLMQYTPIPSTSTLCSSRNILLDGFANYFTARIAESSNRDRLLPVFKELCARIWQLDEAKGLSVLSRPVLQNLLVAVVNIEDWTFLDQAACRLGGRPLSFFTWLAGRVASGPLPLLKIEKRHSSPHLATPENECKEISRRLITSFPEDFDAKETCSYIGRFMVDLLCITEGPERLEVSKLLRIVENNLSNSSFLLGVVDGLRLRAINGTSTQTPTPSTFGPLFDRVARLLINNLDVSKLFRRGPHECPCHGCASSDQSAYKSGYAGPVDSYQLANIVSKLLADGADRLVACFASKVVADVQLIPRQDFASFWIPFLGHLLRVLEETSAPLSTPRYRHLFASILETYLARCVGPLLFTWTPKSKEIDCCCHLCHLFYRFLKSSVPAACFPPVSQSKMRHLNTYLIPQAYKNNQCLFAIEDGSLVVKKLQTVDVQSRKSWAENKEKASIIIRKLDGPALRQILGDEYARIWDFQAIQASQGSSPVPIESLEHAPKLSDPLRPHQPPASMAPTASPGSAHWLGSIRRPNPQGRLHSRNSPIPSSPSTSRAAPAPYTRRTPRNPKKANHDQDGLLTPASSSQAYPIGAADTNLEALSRAWHLMRSKERESYWSGADGAQEPVHPTAVSAANHRPRSTPKGPSPRTPSSACSTALQGSPSLRGRRAASSSASRGPRPLVTVSAPRATAATMQPSSQSPRVFGPISSGRLNSVHTLPGHSRMKTNDVKVVNTTTEVGPPAASFRGAKKRAFEVIDLTGDD